MSNSYALHLRDQSGRRPVLAYHPKLHADPHFRDYVLFHDYFHGDTGRGVGASHQTGWTGLVAATATVFHTISADDWSRGGRESLRPVTDVADERFTVDEEEPFS